MSKRGCTILLDYGACVLLAIACLCIGAIFYLLAFDQNPPITYKNLPFPTTKSAYKPGESVDYTVDYCRDTDAIAPTERHLISADGTIYAINQLVLPLPKKCDRITQSGLIIPSNTPPGRYRIEGRTSYPVNALTMRLVTWQSEEFDIVATK